MKKILILILAVSTLSVISCNSSKKAQKAKEAEQAEMAKKAEMEKAEMAKKGDRPKRPGGQNGPPTPEAMMERMDADGDGRLAKSEVRGRLAERFAEIDANSDGFLNIAEIENMPRPSSRPTTRPN